MMWDNEPMTQVNASDHKLARYLHERSKKWVYNNIENKTEIRDYKTSALLAVLVFDNHFSTVDMFIPTRELVSQSEQSNRTQKDLYTFNCIM